MSSTDNRPVHLFLVALALIGGLTVAAFFAVGKWAVLVPIVAIPLWRLTRSLGVTEQQVRKGWSGRRFKDYWVYEEVQGKEKPSISLKLRREDDDHLVLVVPDDADWRRTMPLWAVDRRRDIMARIITAWAPQDVIWPPGETPPPPYTDT